MLFRKKIEPACLYCRYGTKVDDNLILCSKKGLKPEDGHCFRFRYDPLKRVPAKQKPLDFSKYDKEDFSL